MRGKACCFTGYRKLPEEVRAELAPRPKEALLALIHEGSVRFSAVGALGLGTKTPWRRWLCGINTPRLGRA